MKRMLHMVRPDVIVYCTGITDFKECATKQRLTEAINSFGPIVLAQASDSNAARFIYLSTAYVYDGDKGNFDENDVSLPETEYGKSKLAGENYVRSKFMNYTIFRFAPIFGLGSIYRPSQFDKLRQSLAKKEHVEMPSNELHNFLYIDIALTAIEWAINNETKNKTYNLGGLTKLSWYDFGVHVAKSFGFDPGLIVPTRSEFGLDKDFSVNGSDIVRQLEVDPLILEQSLDLLKQQLIC